MFIPSLQVKILFLKEIQAQWAFGEEKVVEWLSRFGKLIPPLQEVGSEDEDRKFFSFLPMLGRKAAVYYQRIKKLCINCYQSSHIKKNCKNKTVEWFDYVQKFKEDNEFPDEMYENWIKILKLNKVQKQKENQREEHLKSLKAETENERTTDKKESKSTKNKEKMSVLAQRFTGNPKTNQEQNQVEILDQVLENLTKRDQEKKKNNIEH